MKPAAPSARLLLLTLLLGCSGKAPSVPPGPLRLLLDGAHAPDVLVERREVAWPPSLAGSRFLTGWYGERRPDKTRALVPPLDGRPARLELVNLEQQDRQLAIHFAGGTVSPGDRVRVRAGGLEVGTFPLADPLELTLPFSRLPRGRVAVDLTFAARQVEVVAAAVRTPPEAGEARAEGADLVQTGPSLVDLVRPVAGGEVLVGSFVPPASPRPGQRFELTLERGDGRVVQRYTWAPGWWRRDGRTIALPVGREKGFVRVRLRASGAGPAGRWHALGLAGGPEADALKRPPEPPAPPPKLIVVYVMDALRADRLGVLGGPAAASPTCDRLANEGIICRDHHSVAPDTLPSTKALFTGRAFVGRGGWKLLPEDGATLAELLRAAGYRTGLFSGNPHVGPAFGTDRGFEHVAGDVLFDDGYAARPPGYNDNAARVQERALAWLRSLPPGARAFLYLHTIHPHNPYDPPEPFRSRFTAGIASRLDGGTGTLLGLKQRRIAATPADRARLAGLYTGSFAYNDAELAGFLAGLAAWAPPAETLVAVTADHGEELFDHGGVLHGYTLYEEMVHIPLILWAPGRLHPGTIAAPTTTLDLRRTVLELAGAAAPDTPGASPQGPQGRSLLRPERDGETPYLAAASNVKGGIYAAASDRFKLIWAPRTGLGWGMGEGIGRSHDPESLFDLRNDPHETVNLAGSGPLEADWLRSCLLAWVERGRAAAEPAEPAPVDRETLKRLQALGYVN
jgi:arylsulfatase A-like enzyme